MKLAYSIGSLISVLMIVAFGVCLVCPIIRWIIREKRHSTKDEGQPNLVLNHVHIQDEFQLRIDVNAIYERTSNTQSYYNSNRN
jgi:hypothetical protein